MKNLLQLLLVLIPILLVLSCSKKPYTGYRPTGYFGKHDYLTPKPSIKPKTTTTEQSVDIQPEKINLNVFGEESIPFVLNCFRYNTRQPKGAADAKKIVKCCNNEYVLLKNDEKLNMHEKHENYYERCN